MQSIPGIGEITAATLCAEMPEIGTLGRRQAAALTGLAPFPDDSGKRAGQRYVKGGRQMPCNALFMAATAAVRFNRDVKRVYDRLIGKGKPHKVALVAVMRKLIVLANRLLHDDREWEDTHSSRTGPGITIRPVDNLRKSPGMTCQSIPARPQSEVVCQHGCYYCEPSQPIDFQQWNRIVTASQVSTATD